MLLALVNRLGRHSDEKVHETVRPINYYIDEHTTPYWIEMCDATQDKTYAIDGTEVSNFVPPPNFTEDKQEVARNDFLGRIHTKGALKFFGLHPCGSSVNFHKN